MSIWEKPGKSDDWFTPAYIFEALGCGFDMDVAAPLEGPRHVPCNVWIHQKSLSESWTGFVWMNPPFGGRNGIAPWLRKFIQHGNGIALTPDRTSAPWFTEAAPKMDAILFVSPKIKFERPDGSTGDSPGTGTALMAIGRKGAAALIRAESLGIAVRPFR
ncbi:MAG: DNA N-6-adenine-methyltransferase [bacterium]|jgi:hypothetical protein